MYDNARSYVQKASRVPATASCSRKSAKGFLAKTEAPPFPMAAGCVFEVLGVLEAIAVLFVAGVFLGLELRAMGLTGRR